MYSYAVDFYTTPIAVLYGSSWSYKGIPTWVALCPACYAGDDHDKTYYCTCGYSDPNRYAQY